MRWGGGRATTWPAQGHRGQPATPRAAPAPPRRARRTWRSVIQKCTLGSMRAAPAAHADPHAPALPPPAACLPGTNVMAGEAAAAGPGEEEEPVACPAPGVRAPSANPRPARRLLRVSTCRRPGAPRARCFRNPVPAAHPRCSVSPDVPAPGARRASCSVSPPSNAPRSHTYTPCPSPGAPTIPVSPPLPQTKSSPRCMATPWVHRSPVSQPPPQLWT